VALDIVLETGLWRLTIGAAAFLMSCSVARERASQIRGKLSVRSTPGYGTEVVLLAPT
jgi:hypothetical protein